MTAFQPQWQSWEPKSCQARTDKTDKSPCAGAGAPSVSFVSMSNRQVQAPVARPPARPAVVAVPNDVPAHWVQGVADLMLAPRHPDWPQQRWAILQQDARQFLREWAAQAHRLGWDGLDLFGVHRSRPIARVDCVGLVPLLRGRAVLALTDDSAAIKAASGGSLTFCKRAAPPTERCLVWERQGSP